MGEVRHHHQAPLMDSKYVRIFMYCVAIVYVALRTTNSHPSPSICGGEVGLMLLMLFTGMTAINGNLVLATVLALLFAYEVHLNGTQISSNHLRLG